MWHLINIHKVPPIYKYWWSLSTDQSNQIRVAGNVDIIRFSHLWLAALLIFMGRCQTVERAVIKLPQLIYNGLMHRNKPTFTSRSDKVFFPLWSWSKFSSFTSLVMKLLACVFDIVLAATWTALLMSTFPVPVDAELQMKPSRKSLECFWKSQISIYISEHIGVRAIFLNELDTIVYFVNESEFNRMFLKWVGGLKMFLK